MLALPTRAVVFEDDHKEVCVYIPAEETGKYDIPQDELDKFGGPEYFCEFPVDKLKKGMAKRWRKTANGKKVMYDELVEGVEKYSKVPTDGGVPPSIGLKRLSGEINKCDWVWCDDCEELYEDNGRIKSCPDCGEEVVKLEETKWG